MNTKQEYIEQVEKGLRPEYFVKGDKLKTILDAMKETNTPGISVAIIHNFEMAWTKGYGSSDIETQQPVDENTIFQAASISKTLTALAVMKLVQGGKLNLDADINLYLKTWKLPENEYTAKTKVTLRNLLSHTAGVTIHGFPGYRADAEIPTLEQVLKGEDPCNTGKIVVDMEPNTKFSYSGGGTTIAQQVLIDQLQKPFQEIMQEMVLEPLGMFNSFYSNSALTEEQCMNATAGHKEDGEQVVGKRHLYPEMAAAGLWTTAKDLAKFAIEVQKSLRGESNKILTKEFAKIMTTPILSGEYNIGLSNQNIFKEPLLGHNGANEGYSCTMLFHKEKGYGMILMTNSDNGYEMKMPLFRSVAAAYGWDNILEQDYEMQSLPEEETKLFIDNYIMESDKSVKIYENKGELFYKEVFQEPKKLDYVGGHVLIASDREVKLEFREDCGDLYRNGSKIERLKLKEKLAADYLEEGNIEQAVKCYKDLMDKDEDMKNNLENNINNTGYAYLWKGKYEAAIAFLKINTVLFPQSTNVWDSLGEAYFYNKQYELSIEAMGKALEIDPSNKNAVEVIKNAKEFLVLL